MNRGGIGARSLNIELQTALNPSGDRKVERFGWTFAPGDKVMQIENDYDKEVYNGDIGYIDNIDEDSGELIVRFDGRNVTYGFGELDTLVPAYAVTIHKSQGSRISSGRYPGPDPALHHAAAQSALYRRNPWKAAGCSGRTEEGDCHCCTQRVGETALVEVEGMAGCHIDCGSEPIDVRRTRW
jgi:ATP-dependent RecD-like DNA helicase SH3 domain